VLTWVQIVAILAAGGWGVYAFIYTEIMKPRSAPVNISIDLSLQKVGFGKNKSLKPLLGIEMKVSAVNPSSREVFLLPSIWHVHGYTIDRGERKVDDIRDFVGNISLEDVLEIGKHYTAYGGLVVAAGSLFSDSSLKPNEKVSRTLVFYVPRARYDVVKVETFIPTAVRAEELVFKYRLNDEGSDIETALYRKAPDKTSVWGVIRAFFNSQRDPKREDSSDELLADYGEDAPADIYKKYELSAGSSEAELSLWE